VAGGVYHVATRGNNKQPVFGDDNDRWLFLWRLRRVARVHNWICFAYCLMGNHFHLIVKIPDGGLSLGMQQLLSGYSRAKNQREGRCDHVFKQRFFSALFEYESHFYAACRYVALNPVEAGLCAKPEEWHWSSYGACAGVRFAPDFLAVDELLRLFGPDPDSARRRYISFVCAGLGRGPTPGEVPRA
jgi:REP element-mobilizing transposase RayT